MELKNIAVFTTFISALLSLFNQSLPLSIIELKIIYSGEGADFLHSVKQTIIRTS